MNFPSMIITVGSFLYFISNKKRRQGLEKKSQIAHNIQEVQSDRRTDKMDTGVIVAISVVLTVAILAVIICVVSAVGTVSGIKHTNDEDTDA